MQDFIDKTLPLLPIIGFWLLATGLANLVARKSQVDAWCEKRPKLAGALKLLRGIGFDPWMIIQGVSLLIVGKLPAYLRKFIPIFLVALLASGCAATLEESSATARLTSIGPVPVSSPATPKRCQSLSDRETWWGAAAKGGAIATGAAGLATWPVKSHDAEVGLAIGATALAVGTGVAAYVEQQTSLTYVAEGCGK